MTLCHHAGYRAGWVHCHSPLHPQKKWGERAQSSSHVVRMLFKENIPFFPLESFILYTMCIYHIHLLLCPSHALHLFPSIMPSFSVAIINDSLSPLMLPLCTWLCGHRNDCPFLSSHQPPLAPLITMGSRVPPPQAVLEFWLAWSWAANHSCWELVCLIGMPCADVRISQLASLSAGSCILFASSFAKFPERWKCWYRRTLRVAYM